MAQRGDAELASVMRKLIAAQIVVDVYGPIGGPYKVKVVAGDAEITEEEGHALIDGARRPTHFHGLRPCTETHV